MNRSSGEELHEAFDRFLETLFRDGELGRSVAPERGDLTGEMLTAAQLADWVISPPHAVVPPQIGGYRILKEIGHGSMGTVFLALDEKLGREVALKVLPHSVALSLNSRRRFALEYRAMSGLCHDHIVQVYDVIEQGDLLAFAMERVEGPSLHAVLRTLQARRQHTGSTNLEDLKLALGTKEIDDHSLPQFWLRTGIDIARALQIVHEAGLVHRDVKPGNILFRQCGKALLTDFSLVRELDSTMTGTGAFVGTLGYSPPEQLEAGMQAENEDPSLDNRADIYALAATLYECFAGVPPFTGASPAALLRQIGTLGARPLRKVAPSAPRGLDAVLDKALRPQRAQRYASAAELGDELERVLSHEPVVARSPGTLVRGARVLRHRHPVLVGSLIGAVMVFLMAGIWMDREKWLEQRAAAAAEHVKAAQALLVAPEVRHATWEDLQLGTTTPEAFEIAQARRREATGLYDAALRMRADPDVAGERDVLRLVTDLPDLVADALDAARVEREYPALGGIPKEVLQYLVTEPSRRSRLVVPDRQDPWMWNCGLLFYLRGNEWRSETFWGRLRVESDQRPLSDVALATVYADDGRFAMALPRLQRAIERFPDEWHFRLDLTAALLELEDFGSARRALMGVDREVATSPRYLTLRAWANSDWGCEMAIQVMRRLVRHTPESPAVRYRLACVERRAGNNEEALEILSRLVESAPEVPRYRLALARVAVRMGRLDVYLDQARYVVGVRYGHRMSRGLSRDLLDILQVGGLTGLYERGRLLAGHEGSPDIAGLPDAAWAGTQYGSRKQVEDRLRLGG